jgi:hypothetical protein
VRFWRVFAEKSREAPRALVAQPGSRLTRREFHLHRFKTKAIPKPNQSHVPAIPIEGPLSGDGAFWRLMMGMVEGPFDGAGDRTMDVLE